MDELDTPQGGGLAAGEQDPRSRERLLRAAVAVFDRKGYAAASVREIVEQAGIAKPALYYHFGSKEGILVAILEEGARQFERALSRAVERSGTAHERLAALCDEVYALHKQHVPVVRVAHAVFFGPKDSVPAFDFERFRRTLESALGRIIEEGMASGELRQARIEDVSTAIRGVLEICTDQELGPCGSPIACESLHRVLDLIFDGLSATRKEKEN
jgi:AcrR family transcriptional regulator